MSSPRSIRARPLGSLAIVLAALAVPVPPAVRAASPGPAACAEYSVCGGPTGAEGGPGAGHAAGSGSGQHAHPTASRWWVMPFDMSMPWAMHWL